MDARCRRRGDRGQLRIAVDPAAGDPTMRTGRRGYRFGGVPLVGADFAWPYTADGRPLCLVGQWHCDEVNQWLGGAVLPIGILLCFFFDIDEQAGWGLNPQDAPLWRVTAPDAVTAAP